VVLELLRACADRGLAVVASLHQPELAGRFADRVVRFNAADASNGPPPDL
jgi:ABC-type hemin transport system ATPase subunit